MFPSAVREALRRGATGFDLALLRHKYLIWVRHFTQWMAAEEQWSERVIADEESDYDLSIQDEIKVIPEGLKAFCETCSKNKLYAKGQEQRTLLMSVGEYRFHIRPMYYAFGYLHPADFLGDQVKFSLFNKPKLETWVHQDLALRLLELPDVLNRWSAGLAKKTAEQINDVGGLECRTIAGHDALSNHAFGLAIDVEAYSNPHAVGFSTIDVFNSVVREAGVDFDFGKPIVKKDPARFTFNDVVEIYTRELPASNAIRSWLQKHLPRYLKLMAEVQAAEKDLGMSPVPSNTKLGDRISGAEVARNRLQFKRELNDPNKVSEAKFFRSASEPDRGCEPTRDNSPETQALEKFNAALGEIAVDPDLSRIQVLFENFESKYIKTWEVQGILTIPVSFAAALVGELDLMWGEQYKESKDAMHFELVKSKEPYVPYLLPEDGLRHEKPRTLERFMKSSFSAGNTKLRL
jgi:hypothetical protein